MLLNELNLKALKVNAQSVLPVNSTLNVEGRELVFTVTAFQTGFGSGKKTVVSGSIKRVDNGTQKLFENADIEKIRRVVSSLCELTTSGRVKERKPRNKDTRKTETLKQSLAVARRLPREWVKIDVENLRAAFKEARLTDRERAKEALKARAVAPILQRVAKLSNEEKALLLASLQ